VVQGGPKNLKTKKQIEERKKGRQREPRLRINIAPTKIILKKGQSDRTWASTYSQFCEKANTKNKWGKGREEKKLIFING